MAGTRRNDRRLDLEARAEGRKPDAGYLMKISEYQRGYQDAARQMITWLHKEAATMNDAHARRLLDGAAFMLGVKVNNPEHKHAVETRGQHNSHKQP